MRRHMDRFLKKITSKVMKGLKEFDGVETKEGTLRVTTSKCGMHHAAIRLIHKTYEEDLLFIDSKIESGERDYSDDCRNIPYTEATVTIDRPFVNPERNWNTQDTRGRCTVLITNENGVEEGLKEVAEFLSKLF